MEQTIYAYWNGDLIYDILNAVVLVTGGSQGDAYRQLMTSIALMALLISTGIGLAKLRATDTATAFMALTFFYGIFFIPTTTVYIDDVRKNQNYQVDNVPLGLALFGGLTSNVGYWLTNTYETYFTSVDDQKFSQYGFLFGSRLVEELPKQYYKSATIRDNLKNFIINCVNPEFDANPQLIAQLMNQDDVWAFISGATGTMSLNPGRLAPHFNMWTGVHEVLPCVAGTDPFDQTGAVGAVNLDSIIGTFNELNLLGKKMFPGDMNPTWNWMQVSDFETTMLGISRSPLETIRHYAVINMLREANEDRAGVFAATMTAQQLETSYQVMKIIAEGALPKIRNFIEGLIYAVFPIVFLIVIGAGAAGGKVLTMYGMTAVWVQLWAPLYAVINSFMSRTAAENMLLLVDSGGGTIKTIPHMLSMSVSDQAIAGLMTISVPAIALALVKGGAVAASGVVNSLMSPGQSAAGKVGGEVGMGNINAGGVNWGNVTMGTTRMGGTDLRGDTVITQPKTTTNTPHGSFTTDPAGNLTGMSPNPMSAAGAAVKAERQDGGRITDASASGTRYAHGSFAEAGNVSQAGYSAQSMAEFGRRLDTALATRLGAEFRNNVSDGTGRHVGGDARRGSGTSLSTEEAARMRSHLDIGGGARDESYTGADTRSGQSYTEPGGGGTGGAAGAGAGKANNGNLPARSGTVGPDTKHDRALSAGRRIGGGGLVNGGAGLGAETAQRLSDVAKNENGAFTRNEQQWAAQTLAAAVNDVTSSTNDQGIRAASQRFMADNGFSTRLTTGQRASLEVYGDSGQRIERFGNATNGGAINSEHAVVQAAVGLVQAQGYSGVGAYAEAMRRLQQDEGFRAEALGRAMEGYGQTGDPVTGLSDMSDPRSEADMRGSGGRRIEGVQTQGEEWLEGTQARAEGKVAAKQPFSPTSMPDTTRAEGEYARVHGASDERQAQQAEQANFVAGANNLAAQLYQMKEHGMSKVASIAYLGGLGYDSPSGYSAALARAASDDPQLRAEIAQQSSGRPLNEEDLERIFDKVADKLK